MAGRQTRQTRGEIRIGGPGLPADGELDAAMLLPGVSFNGAPPIIPAGAEVTKIGRIECRCGQVLGRILRVPPGNGRQAYYFAEILVDGKVVANRIGPSGQLLADCPGDDGPQELPGSALLRTARTAESRIAEGKLGRVVTYRVGGRR